MNYNDVLGAVDDGTLEIEHDDDGGMTVHIDTDTELGERIEWQAGHLGETPAEFVEKAVQESLVRAREGR